jgi:hypothetical protein
LAAEVYYDALVVNKPAPEAYYSDFIELFLGLEPASKARAAKSKKVNTMGKFDYQILLAPGMETGKFSRATAWCCQLKGAVGIKVASKPFKLGYTLEAAIPWKSLQKGYKGIKGKTLLMSFQVKDADVKGEPSRRTIFWSGDGSNWMSPKNWGMLILR